MENKFAQKQSLNKKICIGAILLVLSFTFAPRTYACGPGHKMHIVKEYSSEEDILELVEFVNLNYDFEVFPELDGIDFFASSRNKDVCRHGFRIDLDDASHLVIEHFSNRISCNEMIKKIVTDFQNQKKLPENNKIIKLCYDEP